MYEYFTSCFAFFSNEVINNTINSKYYHGEYRSQVESTCTHKEDSQRTYKYPYPP